MFWCRFCQPAVRPAPSRLVALALNCQVSQSDASQEFVLSTAHWVFFRQQFGHCFHDVFGYGSTVSVRLCPCLSGYYGSETSPRHALWQPGVCARRGRDVPATEDPAVFLLLLQYGLMRPHTLGRCQRSTSDAHTVRRGCLTEVLYGTTSCDSTSPRHRLHPQS